MRDQSSGSMSDNSLLSRFSIAVALACLCLLLFSCPNPISTDQAQSEAVLSVVGTTPSNGATKVDPGQSIVVNFNKDLDPACLEDIQSPIVISPKTLNAGSAITLTFSYDSPNKNLSIEAHPYLESHATYVVSFETNLKDKSGDTLPKKVDFSFTTGDSPAGDIQINGGPYVPTLDPVQISMPHNLSAVWMRIANSMTELASAGYVDTPPPSWTLAAPDEGTKSVYVQFFNSDKTVASVVRSVSVVRDLTPPTVDSAQLSSHYYNLANQANPLHVTAVASDDLSGIATYRWSGAGVTFSPSPDVQSPAVSINGGSGTDGMYGLSVRVTDRAGHYSDYSTNLTITKDTVPPGKPTESLDSSSYGDKSPLLSKDPTVSWIWIANPNLDSPPDTFQEKLDTDITWTSLAATSLDQSHLADGTYNLMVRQVDAAGNPSPILTMQIIVTPVIPYDGNKTELSTPTLQWRDFSNGSSQGWYRVHIGPSNGSIDDQVEEFPVNTRTFLIPQDLVSGQTYHWYIDFSLDGKGWPIRNPSTAGTYYTFTVQ
jgi:hypothetical protein